VHNVDPVSWAPRPAVVGTGWALTALAALGVLLVGDARGTILMVIAAITLGALSLFGTVARPRLTADQHGVTVRGLFGTRQWRWSEVKVRLVYTRRLGHETFAVELDADNTAHPALVLLGQLDLGADPHDVTDALLQLRS
jgi:hypothetical protein